jgi:hypothetical protein
MIKLIETKLIKETYKEPILKIGDKVTWFDAGGSDEWGIIKAISPETDEYTVKWEDGSSGTYSRMNLKSEMEYYNWLDEEGLDESNSLKEFDDPKDNYDKQGNPRIPIYGHLNSEVVEMITLKEAQQYARPTLYTLQGSSIQRSKFGAGKYIGQQYYIHKNYINRILPQEIIDKAIAVIGSFDYNCNMYDTKKNILRFDSAPDFDTYREPAPLTFIAVNLQDWSIREGFTDSIWHHKWLWVDEDYKGFDINESYNWSKLWLSHMEGTASGRRPLWWQQLEKYGLKEYTEIY